MTQRRIPAIFLGSFLCVSGLCSPVDVASDDYARAPAMSLPSLSPDGGRLAYVSQAGSQQHVVIRELRDGHERRFLEVESRRERIRWCGWAGSDHLLCGTVLPVKRPDRISQTTRLHAIDAGGRRVRELNLRLPDAIRDHVIDMSSPRRVLLQHDPVGRGYPVVSELDVISGALRRLVSAHPPITRWMSDGRGTVRLGMAYDSGRATVFAAGERADDWSVLISQSINDPLAVAPLVIGADVAELYVLGHHEGRAALFRMDALRNSEPVLLFAHRSYDVEGPVVLDPRTRALLSVRYLAHHEEQHFFSTEEAGSQVALDSRLPGTVNMVIGMSADATQRLVRSGSDVEPPSLYLHDARAGTVTLLGHEYPQLEGRRFAAMQPVSYRARDGQLIPGYLTLPANHVKGRSPAMVLPHGGPETRAIQAFDPLVQFLASQGYAVLQMNFRGSFGYGARFAAAGVGEWGGVVHNDITDGARWLIEQQLADPARICIAGSSFGGYAALLGAARESQWYACAISFAGVTDLMALQRYTQRLQSADVWNERLGSDQQRLWQMSPMARVWAVETPVLLMHGRNDPVVPVSQSRRFARELQSAGKPHRFVERVECDHEMTVESCRLDFFAELQQFLQHSLQR